MDVYPTSLSLPAPDKLLIEWSDGERRVCTIRELRAACPCATCREKRSHPPQPAASRSLPVLSAAELQPLRIVKMQPLGNYAYTVAFSDGHDTGIYTFELLRELGETTTS
jgi:DUF971 family protein